VRTLVWIVIGILALNALLVLSVVAARLVKGLGRNRRSDSMNADERVDQ
jgi:hypothetical protein